MALPSLVGPAACAEILRMVERGELSLPLAKRLYQELRARRLCEIMQAAGLLRRDGGKIYVRVKNEVPSSR